MILTGLLLILTLLLKLAPDAPLARLVNRMVVLWPLEQVRQATLQQAIFGLILLGFMLTGTEAYFLLGPELVAGFAFDLSIYLDAVLFAYALSSWGALKAGVVRLRHKASRLLRRPRAPRRKRLPTSRPDKLPANDEEPHPALRLAA